MKNLSSLIRKTIRAVITLTALLTFTFSARAQTTLNVGELIFTGYNVIPTSEGDTFSFVLLAPITQNTLIYFTDRGYHSTGWQGVGTTENTVLWTSGSALSAGTEVFIYGLNAKVYNPTNGTSAVNGTVTYANPGAGNNPPNGLNLSAVGDQIIAFQGGGGDISAASGVTIISGIHFYYCTNGAGTSTAQWDNGNCGGVNGSNMPPGLTGGTNAFYTGPVPSTTNVATVGRFNCNGVPATTVAAVRTAVMNQANWSLSTTTNVTMPSGCLFLSTLPVINTQPQDKSICANANTLFSVSAGNATGYQWQFRTTPAGTFGNVPASAPYTNTTAATLNITGATATMDGYQYRCVVSNGSGSVNSNPGTLTVNTVVPTPTQTNVNCHGGGNGAASVTVTGGTTPYSYNWTPGGSTASGITNLTAGGYSVTITDFAGCQATQSFTITEPATLVATQGTVNPVSCNGGTNGSATVNVSGGSTPYGYSWSPSGGTAATANGLAAGNYTVTITDGHGCQTTQGFIINQPSAYSIGTSSTDVSCNGGANGSATVTVAGATSPYFYSWSPSGGTNATANGLAAGNYTVNITDNNGCPASRSFTINQPSALTATKDSVNINCNGGNTGSATITVSGGTTPYSYSWSPSGGSAASATGLTAGTYTVSVTDGHLCPLSRTFNLTQPSAFSITKDSTNVSCNGGSNGSATINVSGGTTPYSYSWSPSGGSAASATGLAAGTYTVTVTDGHTCQTSRSFNITQPTAVQVAASSDVNICAGSSTGLVSLALGGTAPYTYQWQPGALNGSNQTVSPDSTTQYIVTATDAHSCTGRDTVVVTVVTNLAQAQANGSSVPGTVNSDNSQTSGGTSSYYNGSCGLIASLLPTGGALGTVTASVTVESSVPTFNSRPYVARWYRIVPQNNGPADVTLYFKQSDFDQYNTYAQANGYPKLPQNPTDLAGIDTLVITKASVGDLGSPNAVTSLIHPTSVTWIAAMEYWEVKFSTPSFSQFFVHANNISGTPLPVILNTFEALKDKGTALIRWTTASEHNNAGFTIERSNDGKQFDAIGKVASQASGGNSTTPLSYQFTDSRPLAGLNYYRLLQEDKDGQHTYSDVKVLDFAAGLAFSCYPNPAGNLLKLEHMSAEAGSVHYRILDVMGKVMLQGKLDVQRGFNHHDLDVSGLAQGMYHMIISNDNNTLFRTRFVKQ